MNHALNIKNKITLLASACLVTVVGLLAGLSLEQRRSSEAAIATTATGMLLDAARDNLRAEGRAQALKIQQGFNREHEFVQGVARQVMQLRAQAGAGLMSPQALRQDLTRLLGDATAGRSQVLGLFVVFEPNALDGHDRDFIGQQALGSNDSGRFTLNWLQPTPGQLQLVSGDEKILADTSPGPAARRSMRS